MARADYSVAASAEAASLAEPLHLLVFGGTEALFWSSSLGDVSAKPEELSASSICLVRLLRVPAAFLDDLLVFFCFSTSSSVSEVGAGVFCEGSSSCKSSDERCGVCTTLVEICVRSAGGVVGSAGTISMAEVGESCCNGRLDGFSRTALISYCLYLAPLADSLERSTDNKFLGDDVLYRLRQAISTFC